uniref:Uncharacterized protein n=1 Tax=Triticum urartu TaxID=4572 RepID=A0A8R7Q877_TRIUA
MIIGKRLRSLASSQTCCTKVVFPAPMSPTIGSRGSFPVMHGPLLSSKKLMILSFSTCLPNICPSTKMLVAKGRRIRLQPCRSIMNSRRSPDMLCKLSSTVSISSTPASWRDSMHFTVLVATRTRFAGLNKDREKGCAGTLSPCPSLSSGSPHLIVSSR